MPRRRAPEPAQNVKPDGEKNVRDPAAHPMDQADDGAASRKRRRVSGDGNMRLPYEHDETGDREEERAGETDELLDRAADDAMSDREDTDRRGDAVDVFERSTRRPPRRRH